MIEQRRCNDCGLDKPAEDFGWKSGRRRPRCRPCTNAYNKAHPPKVNPAGSYRTEEYREFNRQRHSRYVRGAGKAQSYARNRAYVEKHPERKRAWAAVHRAIVKGSLARPDRCDCGRDAKVTAHHDDYSKPLDVLWLCTACHKARHEWLNRKAA